MTKQEELNVFIQYTDELIKSNYILAEPKIINLLKAIASSETITRLLKRYLASYNYVQAKSMYMRNSSYAGENRGELVLPSAPKDIFAFVFCLLMDFNSKRIDFAEFLSKYFYENGSPYESYSAFINGVIKPFKRAVKTLMESLIAGSLVDPLVQEEKVMRVVKNTERKTDLPIDTDPFKPYTYGNYTSDVIACLAEDRVSVENHMPNSEEVKKEQIFVINAFQCAVKSGDRETMVYAYITYKYMCLHYKRIRFNLKHITEILRSQKII